MWAASKSFAAFLASRVSGGISKGNVSLSTAMVADLGSPSARSRGMVRARYGARRLGFLAWGLPSRLRRPSPQAVIGVAFSLAFTLGPMLGAFLPAEMVPWLALLFAASDLLFIFCFLPETLPAEKRVRWVPEPAAEPQGRGSVLWARGAGQECWAGLSSCTGALGATVPPGTPASWAGHLDQRPGQVQVMALPSCLAGLSSPTPSPGILYRPGVPGRGRPAQPRGPAPFLGRGPWPGPTRWRR